MYYILSLLSGIIISIMIAFNGGLTSRYGVYSATVIIHIVGLILITAIVILKKDKVFAKRHSWYLYIGGIIGVFTTVFNNMAFGRISVSAILALGLLGQSVSGIIIDQYGLWGMPKHPFSKQKLIGLLIVVMGIISMINSFEVVAVVVSLLTGITLIASRTVNAKLSELTSIRTSTFFNYAVGLLGAAAAFFLLGRSEVPPNNLMETLTISNIHIYLGGILGVAVVLTLNIVVVKVSAFYLTLLMFIGQIFSGIIIDMVLSQSMDVRNLIGGVLVAIGFCVDLLFGNRAKRKENELLRTDVK